MGSNSKWNVFNASIKQAILDYPDKGYSFLAKKVLGPYYEYKDVDVLRTYIRRNFNKKTEEVVYENKTMNSKILIFDIETAPMLAWIWSLWDQNINLGRLKRDWFMLTWSAKWLFEDEVMSDKLTSKEAIDQKDKRIVKSLWELIEEADIIIAHNAIKFDIKRMNTRFLANGISPTTPYKVIDTLAHARKRFAITSNKLDYLGEFLGVGRKMSTGGFKLWTSCMKGKKKALAKMEEYNVEDVRLLERVYLKLRPWIQPHPNIGLYIEDNISACPACGSDDLVWKGYYVTSVSKYQAFKCNFCGSIGRSRKSLQTKNKLLTVSITK